MQHAVDGKALISLSQSVKAVPASALVFACNTVCSSPRDFPCCVRFPCVHAVANTCEVYICAEPSVTQCYRMSPGPDFAVIADLPDMAACNEFASRLLESSSNVCNVRMLFSTHRVKFEANAPVVNLSKAAV